MLLCSCGHASGHHDPQQNGRCLRHRCGCLHFDPDEAAGPADETPEEIRLERDALVAMYTRSQTNTTHECRMMKEALGYDEDHSHTVFLMAVCAELKRLRKKEIKNV